MAPHNTTVRRTPSWKVRPVTLSSPATETNEPIYLDGGSDCNAARRCIGGTGAADDDAALVQRYAADSIVLDELIIGFPLNAADRRYVLKDAARNVRSSPDFAVRADAYARETLADAKCYPARVGGLRESLRFLAATQPAENRQNQASCPLAASKRRINSSNFTTEHSALKGLRTVASPRSTRSSAQPPFWAATSLCHDGCCQ